MISDADLDQMVYTIGNRPRMYCSSIETSRDLIFFLLGVSRGAVYPAHAPKDGPKNEDTLAFRDYVYRRFNRQPPWPGSWREGEFVSLLLEEFGEKSLEDVHIPIVKLLRGVRLESDDPESI